MGLRNFVDKIKPTFSEGGKLSFLHSTFEGFETFLFVPNTTTAKGAHIRDCNDIKRVMITVVVALFPVNNTIYAHRLYTAHMHTRDALNYLEVNLLANTKRRVIS